MKDTRYLKPFNKNYNQNANTVLVCNSYKSKIHEIENIYNQHRVYRILESMSKHVTF